MKIFINTNDWTISKIENETPIVTGDNYVDTINVYYNNDPAYLNIIPTLNLLKPNNRKVGSIPFDIGTIENPNPSSYTDEDSNTWYRFVFTLSSDNGQIDEKGKYQCTIVTNYLDTSGNITAQRNVNVQFNVFYAVKNENSNILILSESNPDQVIADVYQLVQTLSTSVSALGLSKVDKADIGYIEITYNGPVVQTITGTLTSAQLAEASKKYCILRLKSDIYGDNVPFINLFYKYAVTSGAYFFRTIPDVGSNQDVSAFKSSGVLVFSNGDYQINAIETLFYNKSKEDELLNTKVSKTQKVNGHELSGDITLDKGDVGLGNVDNTSDANKPISNATQSALDLKVDKSSIVDNTTTNDDTKVLSAKQGKVLRDNLGSETTNRQNADNNLQSQIDGINAGQNLADIVADLTALGNLDTTKLQIGDKVEVLNDSNHDNVSTVYNWNGTAFVYIGAYGMDSYTKAQMDSYLANKQDKIDSSHKLSSDLVDDTGHTNKFVTEAQKVKIDNAYGPSYVGKDTSTNILAKGSDTGICVGTDNNHWYYWNGSQYADGGVYQATIDNNDAIVEPTLRNGSIGNVDNANGICFVNTLGFNNTKGCFVKINYTLPSGYNFYIELDTNSVSNVPVNTNVVYTYRPYIRTTKNYFYIDFSQFSSSAVAFSMVIYVRKTDDTDFIPLRIATNQYCVSIIYNYELNGKTADEINNNMIVSPVLRNGTLTNEGNSDYVCTKKSYGFNGAKGMWIKINKELPTGYKFYMQCNINSAIGVNPTSNVVYEYRPLLRISKNLFYWKFPIDISNAVAFSMDFTMKKDDDTGNISLRIEQDLEIFFIYDVFGLYYCNADKLNITPALRNGSIGNAGNVNGVTTKTSLPINNAKGIAILINDLPLNSGYEYQIDANLHSVVNSATDSNVVQEYRPLVKTDKNVFYWKFPKTTNAIAYSITIYRVEKNGGSGRQPIRIETSPNALTIIYDYFDDTSNLSSNEITTRILNARHIIRDYGTPLTLLHISDLHKDTGALAEILEDANNYSTYIDGKICTGDIVENTATQISSWWDPSIMTCMGNHDTATYDSETGYDWTALSMANRSAYYIEPFKSNWGGVVHTNGKSYYYKDYTTQKVRLIVMDGMLYTDVGQEATDQNTWLTDLLADAITNNLHVLIAIHSPHNGSKAIPCSFSRYNQTDIPENWDTSCVTPQSVIDIVAAKITNGLHFIGYIVGHTHQDNIWDAVGDRSQLMYCITTASNSKPQWTGYDLYKGSGRNAYNLITIDTYNTLIKIIRCGGANVDDHMRKREMICFDYSKGDIVNEQ